MKNSKTDFTRVQKITTIAILSALSIVANIFSVPITGSNYLSFVYIPCFLAGIYLGIIGGAAVGFMGDVVGFLIHPTGPYNPLITVATVLLAVIPAIAFKFLKAPTVAKLIFSLILTTLICTCGINTVALWLMYGIGKKTFWVYLWGRLPFQLLMVLVNGIALIIIVPSLDKIFLKLNANEQEEEQ